jgi:uncharacterized protein (TIGR02246 family)
MFTTIFRTIAEQDERAIKSLLGEVIYAFNTGDLEKLLSFHTDDVILMEPHMPLIRGKQKIRSLFEDMKRKNVLLKLKCEIEELEIVQDRAFVRGNVIKRILKSGSFARDEKGKFICLLKKQTNGEWLRTHVIVNSDQ